MSMTTPMVTATLRHYADTLRLHETAGSKLGVPPNLTPDELEVLADLADTAQRAVEGEPDSAVQRGALNDLYHHIARLTGETTDTESP